MELIKENNIKKRKVYKGNRIYKKVWLFCDSEWIQNLVALLDRLLPGYVVDYGFDENKMYMTVNEIRGNPVNTYEHTDKFIKEIVNFCKENIEKTQPYAHMDWVLSNIIDTGEGYELVDWDNLQMVSLEEARKKLRHDLLSAFGEKINDYM